MELKTPNNVYKQVTIPNDLNEIRLLLKRLLNGTVSHNEFRYKIQQYKPNKVKTLLRDMLPNFSKDAKEKICNMFLWMFYPAQVYIERNPLYQFTDSNKFWQIIKITHDKAIKKINLYELIKILSMELLNEQQFSTFEEKILLYLEKQPTVKYKELADFFSTTQKNITVNISNLKKKGIKIGSIIDYNKINVKERVIVDKIPDGNFDIFEPKLVERYMLFPKREIQLVKGFNTKDIKIKNVFEVITKKHITNVIVFLKNLSPNFLETNIVEPKITTVESKNDEKLKIRYREYIFDLLENCESNYKHPGFKNIIQNYNVSLRTLLRVKSRLLQESVIKPCIRIESKKLLKLLVLSKEELSAYYNTAPQVEVFQIENKAKEKQWISIFSIFPKDLNFFLREYDHQSEIFVVQNKIRMKF